MPGEPEGEGQRREIKPLPGMTPSWARKSEETSLPPQTPLPDEQWERPRVKKLPHQQRAADEAMMAEVQEQMNKPKMPKKEMSEGETFSHVHLPNQEDIDKYWAGLDAREQEKALLTTRNIAKVLGDESLKDKPGMIMELSKAGLDAIRDEDETIRVVNVVKGMRKYQDKGATKFFPEYYNDNPNYKGKPFDLLYTLQYNYEGGQIKPDVPLRRCIGEVLTSEPFLQDAAEAFHAEIKARQYAGAVTEADERKGRTAKLAYDEGEKAGKAEAKRMTFTQDTPEGYVLAQVFESEGVKKALVDSFTGFGETLTVIKDTMADAREEITQRRAGEYVAKQREMRQASVPQGEAQPQASGDDEFTRRDPYTLEKIVDLASMRIKNPVRRAERLAYIKRAEQGQR